MSGRQTMEEILEGVTEGIVTLSVTYEIVTEESAEEGEAQETGFEIENEVYDLSDEDEVSGLIRVCEDFEGGELSTTREFVSDSDWITRYEEQDYVHGYYRNRSLHLKSNVGGLVEKILGVLAR